MLPPYRYFRHRLNKIDQWLIELFDLNVAKAQRRGAHLFALKVYLAFAVAVGVTVQWLTAAADAYLGFVNVLLFGGLIWNRVREFKRNADYHDVARKIQRLNAEVLWQRESFATGRLMFGCMFMFLFVFNVFLAFIGQMTIWVCVIDAITWSAMLSTWYLDCCFYLGPGEHSREKQEAPMPLAPVPTRN